MAFEVDGAEGRTTVHALELDLADASRTLWRRLNLRTARHSSESAAHFVTRLLAYGLHWSETLAMRDVPPKGNEAVLWQDDPHTGRNSLWIDVGRVDHERLRHALSRADEVVLYACPADETVLAQVRLKHFAGKRTPRIFLLPHGLVEGAAAHLERRLEWYLSRDGDDLMLAVSGATFEGSLVEVHFAGRG